MKDMTTASTHHGPPVTIEGIRKMLAFLEEMPAVDNTPIRLTQRELDRLANLLGLQLRLPGEEGLSSLVGIPIMVLPEGHPLAKLFDTKQRIERSHPLLRRLGGMPC